MPRRWVLADDETSSAESDFSETDVSYTRPGRRTVVKRRSFSRARRHSPNSNGFLTPAVIAPPPRRAASTGGRRRGGDDPVVVVDVHNDVHAKQESRDRRNHYERRDERRAAEDDVEDVARAYRRPRVVAEASRTPSPRQRDWELLMDQRIMANNDIRQDLELAKQQQEIDQLERQLAKIRAKRHEERHEPAARRRLAEEEFWEEELAEKLRKLERLERSRRSEDVQKAADERARMKRLEEIEQKMAAEDEQRAANQRARFKQLEEAERKAAEEAEAERMAQEKHLKALEKQEKIRAERERYKQEIRDEEARKLLEEQERKKELDEIKSKAILEWKHAEEARKLREIEEKKAKDEEFKERLKLEFGLSEEELEKRLKKPEEEKKEKKEKKEEKPEKAEGALVFVEPPPEKTTYIRVHRKYLQPATLEAYKLPWDWDNRDHNYIIIKQWISEDFQEELFAHTRRLRGGKLIEETSTTLTELKVDDRKRDRMYLVRKKNANPRAWIFT
ncbi:hypothetical protein UA08_04623 [Talaromyces atroroseus]|uniref:Uncharacterized protein n=1 Tax=Talaromyces atroroseus TaxID=1441469 RepID=A0A225AFV1_TALAT|nr:hypothetical protein UA08_04623 [Talaromyces atroroseus]OKL60221.1 hypothetical protein UA08_04623 [Talaromyces atroroseus]